MALQRGDGEFPHIEIERQPDQPERRKKRPFFPQVPAPPDRARHAAALASQTEQAIRDSAQHRQAVGIDPNRLIVLEFNTVNYDTRDDFVERFNAHVVDESVTKPAEQENTRTVVQFPTVDEVRRFEREIDAYRGGAVTQTALPPATRRKFFDSVQRVGRVTSQDRMGRRLKAEGFPATEPFYLDVDLWRPEEAVQPAGILPEFRDICQRNGGRVTGEVHTASLVLLKILSTRAFAGQLLELDLVARVDLPPRIAAGYTRLFQDFPSPGDQYVPDETDPILCIVDSGVVSGHPCLRNWVVAERDFETGENTEVDRNGHGTSVAGLAVYGSIAACLDSGHWLPKVKICSAKVLRNEENPIDPNRPRAIFPDENRIEHTLEQAIRHFHADWGCRVFNLSVGDDSAPYQGGRQFPWAEKLDELARELDIVMVVSAGNRYPELPPMQGSQEDIQRAVRDQLLSADHRICNPATAALAITVGSIARNDVLSVHLSGRDLAIRDAIPASPKGGPSPFTRTGPGCAYRKDNESIKPELVEYGGNYALQRTGTDSFTWNDWHFLVGEPTIIPEQDGRFVGSRTGTSFACPHVAHSAAIAERSLYSVFNAPPSANAIRALVAGAAMPPCCGSEWLADEDTALRLTGYGQPQPGRVAWSSERAVCLAAEDEIEEDKLHFLEIPVPPSFLSGKGERGITVALAYDPPVRSSRKEYLARTMFVDVMQGLTTQEVARYKAGFQGSGKAPSAPAGAMLALRPPLTTVQWSTLQVRRIAWTRAPRLRSNSNGDTVIHVVAGCQRRFPTGLDSRQRYAIVVGFWHRDEGVRLYQDLRALIRQPVRVKVRV